MHTAPYPKRVQNFHLAVNSGHVAKGIVRTWEARGKERVCKLQQPQNGSPSQLAVNSGHVANSNEIERTWDASGKRMVCKLQQAHNGSPRIVLSILRL